jgi:hypothetical protein
LAHLQLQTSAFVVPPRPKTTKENEDLPEQDGHSRRASYKTTVISPSDRMTMGLVDIQAALVQEHCMESIVWSVYAYKEWKLIRNYY